jgi:hypothetical protein
MCHLLISAIHLIACRSNWSRGSTRRAIVSRPSLTLIEYDGL